MNEQKSEYLEEVRTILGLVELDIAEGDVTISMILRTLKS